MLDDFTLSLYNISDWCNAGFRFDLHDFSLNSCVWITYITYYDISGNECLSQLSPIRLLELSVTVSLSKYLFAKCFGNFWKFTGDNLQVIRFKLFIVDLLVIIILYFYFDEGTKHILNMVWFWMSGEIPKISLAQIFVLFNQELSINVTELRLIRCAVMGLCFLAQSASRSSCSETARVDQFTSRRVADQTAETAGTEHPVITSPAAPFGSHLMWKSGWQRRSERDSQLVQAGSSLWRRW